MLQVTVLGCGLQRNTGVDDCLLLYHFTRDHDPKPQGGLERPAGKQVKGTCCNPPRTMPRPQEQPPFNEFPVARLACSSALKHAFAEVTPGSWRLGPGESGNCTGQMALELRIFAIVCSWIGQGVQRVSQSRFLTPKCGVSSMSEVKRCNMNLTFGLAQWHVTLRPQPKILLSSIGFPYPTKLQKHKAR